MFPPKFVAYVLFSSVIVIGQGNVDDIVAVIKTKIHFHNFDSYHFNNIF